MLTLQNNFLKVEVNPKGAELYSLYNKTSRLEHLWQGDPAYWSFRSPVLFPIVGNLMNDQLLIGGQTYDMKRHGFARHSDFQVLDAEDSHLKLSLEFSEDTLRTYPYKFTFQVLYDLFDSELRISYKVINQDDKTIYFSVGAHPAFNIPFYNQDPYEDYYVEFVGDERLIAHELSENGYFNGKTNELILDGRKLHLSHKLFEKGALVFKKLRSKQVIIKNHKLPNFISVTYPHFDSLGIWAAPNAPFVCIEPWVGYAANEGPAVEFNSKPGVRSLEHGHVFEIDYVIGVA